MKYFRVFDNGSNCYLPYLYNITDKSDIRRFLNWDLGASLNNDEYKSYLSQYVIEESDVQFPVTDVVKEWRKMIGDKPWETDMVEVEDDISLPWED